MINYGNTPRATTSGPYSASHSQTARYLDAQRQQNAAMQVQVPDLLGPDQRVQAVPAPIQQPTTHFLELPANVAAQVALTNERVQQLAPGQTHDLTQWQDEVPEAYAAEPFPVTLRVTPQQEQAARAAYEKARNKKVMLWVGGAVAAILVIWWWRNRDRQSARRGRRLA